MSWSVVEGDCREVMAGMEPESVHCIVTSPPYWGLRDYGVDGQLGLEPTPDAYVERMVEVFREVRRVLRPDGTVWLNLGDSYAGSWGAQSRGNTTGEGKSTIEGTSPLSARQIAAHPQLGSLTGTRGLENGLKPKDLIGIPWRVAFALQADGWWLRSAIVWSKPNPMPESVTDRPTSSYEMMFLLTKSARYFYDQAAVSETSIHAGVVIKYDGSQKNCQAGDHINDRRTLIGANGPRNLEVASTRNLRNVWTISTEPFPDAHFATFPKALVEPCVKAGCPASGTVLDPFAGSGTTGVVALRLGRSFVGIELSPVYAEMARERIRNDGPLLNVGAEMTAL